MNRRVFSAAAIAIALAAPGAFAKNDAMSLIPNDAVTVGVVRLADARTSPLSSMLFQQTDKVTTDGDAAQFLADAGLEPTKDVDVLVVSTSPRAALGRELHSRSERSSRRVSGLSGRHGQPLALSLVPAD